MKEFFLKYLSRKFLLTVLVIFCSVYFPKIYKEAGVSDSIALAVLALLGGVGVAYGFVNVKDASLEKKKE